MTTAMDEWAAARHGDGEQDEAREHDIHEGDIVGTTLEPGAFEGVDATNDDAAGVDADAQALAAKKAKDKKMMMIAGGVLATLAIGVGGLKLMSGGAPSQQIAVQEQAPMPAPVAATPAVPQEQVLAAQPMGAPASAAAPVDFGMQPPQMAPVLDAPMAPASAAQPPMASTAPMPMQPPVAPITVAPTSQVLPPVGAPSPSIGKQPSPATTPASNEAEMQELRAMVKANTAAIEELAKRLDAQAATQAAAVKQVAARPAIAPVTAVKPAPVAKQAALPKPAAADKPFVGITEKKADGKPVADVEKYAPIPATNLSEPKATPSAPAPVAKGGRVRGDFTVYAISNGRAWVHWSGDGENHMVGPNSVLPDNSRVTSIDDVKGVVMTTGGEVHAKPAK